MKYLSLLKDQFNSNVRLREKRPGTQQLIAPLYHEDGDLVDIFLESPNNGNGEQTVRICDHGMTLMRLSYSFDLDTDNKQKIFNRILSENQIENDDGNLLIDVPPENLSSGVLHFAQTVAKVGSLEFLRREIVSGLFFETLTQFVSSKLGQFNPKEHYLPIPERDDLEVDFVFEVQPHPIYLFAVNSNQRARLATISCHEFYRAGLPYRGYVAHENFNGLSPKDRSRITSAADKQFVSFDDFRQHADDFLTREVA